MSTLTPPIEPQNFVITGDFDILNSLDSGMGNGTFYIRNGGLYVNGLTDLDETTIVTNNGAFNVFGSNSAIFNVSSAISLTAVSASNFTTTTGGLTLASTDASTGKITISAAGSGTNSILMSATNATDGQVNIQSVGDSTSIDAIKITASGTTGGNILITGAGDFSTSVPAVKISATNATSGQILLTSAGNIGTTPAINILATGTAGGNVNISGAGDFTGSVEAVKISATSASGRVLVQSAGTSDQSIYLASTAGGIKVNAAGKILITTTDTTNGIAIGNVTAGTPITIGTSTSLTTISGDLTVLGTTTTINTISMNVDQNLLILNSGLATIGASGGLAVRRYQTANNTPTGDVIVTSGPIQESGAFQSGSSTPGTLVLDTYTSSTTDFYKGWWIQITSGTGVGQVRRIKSYNGTTKTATLYVTADNSTVAGSIFSDGLNLTTAPAAVDTYKLFCGGYVANYYDEQLHSWNIGTTPTADSLGISLATLAQPQKISTGAHNILAQTYNNVNGTSSGAVVTFTIKNHGISSGDKISLTNSANFTPAITPAVYTVISVPTANTFTITAQASVAFTAASSATIRLLTSSVIKVNVIQPLDPEMGINIPGVSQSEFVLVTKTSTAFNTITNTTVQGSYIIMISDYDNITGASATFAVSSSGVGGSISRLSTSRGSDGQRLDATWTTGNQVQFRQSTAGLGSGTYRYIVKIMSVI